MSHQKPRHVFVKSPTGRALPLVSVYSNSSVKVKVNVDNDSEYVSFFHYVVSFPKRHPNLMATTSV